MSKYSLKENFQLKWVRIRYELRSLVAVHPWLFFPLVRLMGKDPSRAVGPNTEIVIEGFPKSANSFCRWALESVQSHSVITASHLHAPAQVIRAAHNKIPCLVLIRKPLDAVTAVRAGRMEFYEQNPSLIPTTLEISMRQLLRYYIRFYSSILPYRRHFIIGCFEEITRDFGTVIKRINQRFGTDFRIFNHTEANAKKIFDIEIHVGPTSRREQHKKVIKEALDHANLKDVIHKAENIYNKFQELSRE